MRLDETRRGLVITGPNTGGKTIALKTLGLMALMHQFGLQIPAREASELPVFEGVYADIGDAQSIDRSVSTFSSHMERVIRILAHASDRSLVLLDELGTGTDPEEGSALARAILDCLVSNGAWTCITTHHRPVSEFAAKHDHLANASVELDPETMLPNYRLIMGLPGQSYAMQVAQRLGLEQPIVDHAVTMLDPLRSQTESLLKSLQQERDQIGDVQQQAAEDRAEAERMRAEAEAHLQYAENERDKAIEEAREQLKSEAQRVRRQLRRLMREAERDNTWQEARQSAADVARSVNSEAWMATPDSPLSQSEGGAGAQRPRGMPTSNPPKFAIGDVVRVESLGLTGEIVELDRDERAVILSGSMRFQARPHMMTLVKASRSAPTSRSIFIAATNTDQDDACFRRCWRFRCPRFPRPYDRIDDPAIHRQGLYARPHQRPHNSRRRNWRAPTSRPRYLVTRIPRRNLPTGAPKRRRQRRHDRYAGMTSFSSASPFNHPRPQLPASRVDIDALLDTHRRRHAVSSQFKLEPLGLCTARATVRPARSRVDRDQIHMAQHSG